MVSNGHCIALGMVAFNMRYLKDNEKRRAYLEVCQARAAFFIFLLCLIWEANIAILFIKKRNTFINNVFYNSKLGRGKFSHFIRE